MENYIGDIKIFAQYDLERLPYGWIVCDGSRYDKKGKYKDLGSVIGYQFGSDDNSFYVPDLRGMLPIGIGKNKDGITRVAGDKGGKMGTQLQDIHLLNHKHGIKVGAATAIGVVARNCFGVVVDESGDKKLFYSADPPKAQSQMHTAMMGVTGKSTPISNVQPVLGMIYAIATAGIYPPKS